MPRVETERISAERLESWKGLLSTDHATPAILLGIGHDENSGALIVIHAENISRRVLIGLLKGAIAELLR
jgi:hypothetical protein